MQPEVPLQKKLYDIFSEYYVDITARKLARSHVEAHQIFLTSLGFREKTSRRPGAPECHQETKPLRLLPIEPVPDYVENLAPSDYLVAQEVIDEEILSFLHSVDAARRPVSLRELLDTCLIFGWGFGQLQRTLRRLKRANLIDGTNSTGYVLFDRNVHYLDDQKFYRETSYRPDPPEVDEQPKDLQLVPIKRTAKPVSQSGRHNKLQAIDEEILSFLRSANMVRRPAQISRVLNSRLPSGCNFNQLKTALRRLKRAKRITGTYESGYVLLSPDVPSRVEPKRLEADKPTDCESHQRQACADR